MSAQEIARNTNFGTYRSQGLPAVDFDDFHRHELPARLAGGVNERVAWDVEGRAPISIALPDGRAYTYVCGRLAGEEIPPAERNVEVFGGNTMDSKVKSSRGA